MLDSLIFVLLVVLALVASSLQATTCPPDYLIAPCRCVQYFNLIKCENVNASTDLRKIFAQLTGELAKYNDRPVYDRFELVNSTLEELGQNGVDVLAGVSFRHIGILRNSKLRRIDQNAFRSSANATTELFFEDNVKLGTSEKDNVALFEAINRFSNLHMLRLVDSGIRFVPERAFHLPQPALYEILMTDNRIERIDDNAFTGLDNLSLLNLDANQISQLSPRSLEIAANPKHADKLLKIYMRSNQLKSSSFPPGIFSRLRRQVYLNLDFNNITTVPQSVFQSFSIRRSVLSLLKNPVKCDCNFKWLLDQSLLFNSSNKNSSFMLRDYQCTSDKDEEQLISEADASDFDHCINLQNTKPNRNCINQTDPESEHACLTGGAVHSHLNSMLAHLITFFIFRFLCQ